MIKTKPYRYFTILMAFVVLLSSTGFGLVEHSCMMRGKSVALAAVGKADSGCKACKPAAVSEVRKSSALQFKAKPCCVESQKFQKLEIVSPTTSTVKVFKGLFDGWRTLGEHVGSPLHLLCHSERSRRAPFSSNTFSSLLYGRTMLLFVQCFLI